MNWRNLTLLCIAQACAAAPASLIVLVGGILGAQLAPSPFFSTFPIASLVMGVATFTIPASYLMKHFGRKAGFIGALVIGSGASLGIAFAIHIENFFLLCGMIFLIGGNGAFVQQYRFAAAESVTPTYVSRAVAYVLVGGVLSGYLGPEIGRTFKDAFAYGPYTGSFLFVSVLYLGVACLLLFLKPFYSEEIIETGSPRSFKHIARQSSFQVAVLAATVSYAVMACVMTATPISMHLHYGYSIDDTALVIQSHVIAMYLPSFVTGHLIEKFGVRPLMMIGNMILCVSIGISSLTHTFWAYWLGLICLGLGWNFLFVGGTVLLTQTYHHAQERFKAQAFNDFSVFGCQALASLSAGSLLFASSWPHLNLMMVPALALMGLVLIFSKTRFKEFKTS